MNRLSGLAGRLAGHSAPRFVLVGVINYVVDAGLLYVLHGLLGVELVLAATISFAASFVVNFGLNRVFTFAATGAVGPQMVKLLVLVGLNYLSTIAIIGGLSLLWKHYLVSKTIATVVNAIFNYFAYRAWVFKSPAEPAESGSDVQTSDYADNSEKTTKTYVSVSMPHRRRDR